ncbi:MAG: DUF4328 domain-containing protein [Bacteroidetes bacterium]|nr:DUF4328 domain-containing protein [Bacteroidota bacterium]MCL2302848.1 DUF4328 domain-containing protein [Lentimicrobiaceae bacterium]
MKKITNNASLGKLAMLFNALILGMFIVSMVCLMNFDKVNIKLVQETPGYENAARELSDTERPRRQAQAEVDYYAHKLDTLKQQPASADKKKAKEQQEEIERTTHTLAEKEAELKRIDEAINTQLMFFEAVKIPHYDLMNLVNSAKKTFMITLWITILLFVAKVLFFAAWNYKNLLNLHITSPWMAKSTSPYWAYLGWLIPGYNFIKPYMVYAEIYNETNYILLDKNIIQKDVDSNADFNLGMWWGLLIMAVVVMSYIINATFFNEGPMHYKFSHLGVVITAIAFWALYLLQETVLIHRGIKMNQILIANRPKFDHQ